ncbi:PIN domain-containing protein [Pseudothauera nasutitermitis]|uniref:hypothetical protein n=1 Tax=Pseudothauera nasutitermitis TaxID=2565930 RepID=UPI001E2C72C3|nr:hypothetical protein [Pseudothauera nasutitermitis]
MYPLDTNVVSELRKPKPHGAVVAWLQSVEDAALFLSAVTLDEIQAGIGNTREQDSAKAGCSGGKSAEAVDRRPAFVDSYRSEAATPVLLDSTAGIGADLSSKAVFLRKGQLAIFRMTLRVTEFLKQVVRKFT